MFAYDLLYPLWAYSCFGCFISPSSGRFNYVGYLFWVSIIYWIIMLANVVIIKLAKKELPYKAPKINSMIFVLCVLAVPFTMGASLIMLVIFSCVLEIVNQIFKTSEYMRRGVYLKCFTFFQLSILLGLILIIVFKPNIQKIKRQSKMPVTAGPNLFAKPVKGKIIKAQKGESLRVMLLNYAFWMLNSDYSFQLEELSLLKNIADEFKKSGIDRKYQKLMELYNKYEKDTFVTSYLPEFRPSYINMVKRWEEVRKSAEAGNYQDAINASEKDSYSLAKIAQVMYKKTEDRKKALDLADRATEQYKMGGGSLPALVETYNDLGEFEKAYGIVMLSSDSLYWSTQTLPIIKYFADKQDVDVAIQLIVKTSNGNGRAEALLYLAQTIKDGETPLNRKHIHMLDSTLK